MVLQDMKETPAKSAKVDVKELQDEISLATNDTAVSLNGRSGRKRHREEPSPPTNVSVEDEGDIPTSRASRKHVHINACVCGIPVFIQWNPSKMDTIGE